MFSFILTKITFTFLFNRISIRSFFHVKSAHHLRSSLNRRKHKRKFPLREKPKLKTVYEHVVPAAEILYLCLLDSYPCFHLWNEQLSAKFMSVPTWFFCARDQTIILNLTTWQFFFYFWPQMVKVLQENRTNTAKQRTMTRTVRMASTQPAHARDGSSLLYACRCFLLYQL